jgi:hypothetical protein
MTRISICNNELVMTSTPAVQLGYYYQEEAIPIWPETDRSSHEQVEDDLFFASFF